MDQHPVRSDRGPQVAPTTVEHNRHAIPLAARRVVTGRRRMTAAGVTVLVAAVVLTACTDRGQPEPSPADKVPETSAASTVSTAAAADDRASRSDAVLAALDPAQPGCSAAAAIDGQVVWTGARGLADLESGIPLTTDTRFDVGSVSKQFTATAILLLSADGALSLQDPVSKYVPGLPGWGDEVSIDQLIHHTSGIPNYETLFMNAGTFQNEQTSQQDAVDAVAAVTDLRSTPGSEFEYSNSNYVLLAEVAAAASGRPLPDLLAERVFKPLGLAMVMAPNLHEPGVATGYSSANGIVTPVVVVWDQIGDGAIVTTPTQLVRWADNYRTGQLGGPGLLTAVTADAQPIGDAAGTRYGAGINITSDGFLSHPGGWAGYRSFLSVSPDRRTSVAGSCNAEQDVINLQDTVGGLHSIWFD